MIEFTNAKGRRIQVQAMIVGASPSDACATLDAEAEVHDLLKSIFVEGDGRIMSLRLSYQA
jgi:hypothetical protein